MKKLLLLLLSCAALFSCAAAARAADAHFTDAGQINYTEAVEKLADLGVVAGFPDGSFAPQGSVTREQAAKLVSYLLLGKEQADKLTAKEAPFTDVAAGRWSAGYIAFCEQKAIIAGYGDGSFGPADKVTANQFAKMLLLALGYGVNKEYAGADGGNWAAKAYADALALGIFAGNTGVAGNDAASREEAALYAYNALYLETVAYDGPANGYVPDGRGTLAESVFNETGDEEEPVPVSDPNELTDNMVLFNGEYTEKATADGMTRTYIVYKDGRKAGVTYEDGVDVAPGFYTYPRSGLKTYTGDKAVYGATVEELYNGALTLSDGTVLVVKETTLMVDLTSDSEEHTSLTENGKTVTIAACWSVNGDTGVKTAVAIYILAVE